MSSVPVCIRAESDFESVLRWVADRRRMLSNAVPPLRDVAKIMREEVAVQFQQGGDPAWAPLAPSTVAAKRRMGYPRLGRDGKAPPQMMQRGAFGPENILIRTGAGLSSWTDASDPDHIEDVRAGEVTIGSGIDYMGAHQKGGRRLPRRAIRITERMIQRIIERLTGALKEAS